MASNKINPASKTNPDIGFGVQASQLGGRFVNKDGSFNIRKVGLHPWDRISVYSFLLELSWLQFLLIMTVLYVFINIIFTVLYLVVGISGLQGLMAATRWGVLKEVFFFSTQTFTTVGYGRINPIKDGADFIASIEAFAGWLSFALVTGLVYGRFTRPRPYLKFSEEALISPFRGGLALMFRIVPYKANHNLTDARAVVNSSFRVTEDDKPVYKFYQLKLELSRIDSFNMNWTVVHPIDEESPFLGFTQEDLAAADLELYVQVTGFDHIFSNVVMQRTSYTYSEIVWGGKFKPMYHESEDGNTTILELDKLNDYDKVTLSTDVPQLK